MKRLWKWLKGLFVRENVEDPCIGEWGFYNTQSGESFVCGEMYKHDGEWIAGPKLYEEKVMNAENTNPPMAAPRVVCAAARHRVTGRIALGARHMDARMREAMGELWKGSCDQGFIDQFGNFLTREEAWIIAEKNGQIFRRCGGDGKELYSENLY